MLAVAGGKGGCGKTTTAVGLAAALAETGHRPLVVDADLGMPDLHVRLGLDRYPGLGALAAGKPLDRVARRSPDRPTIGVCPAGRADPPVAPALECARDWAGPVLVDCPAGAGPDAADPLRVADGTVVVSTDSPESLEDAAKTAAMARTLGAPPVAALVRGDPDEGLVERLLECRVETVPSVAGDPHDQPAVRTSYGRLAEAIEHRGTPVLGDWGADRRSTRTR